MQEVAAMTDQKPRPWYQWERCPLVPIYKISKGDEHNSTRIYFCWLVFNVWDAMSPNFGIDLDVEFYGITLRLSVPYIHFRISIPLPVKWDMWAHRYLWRVGKRSYFKWQR